MQHRILNSAAYLSLVVLAATAGLASAQNGTGKNGPARWGVKKLSTNIDGPVTIVRSGLTEEQAKKEARELNRRSSTFDPFFFMAYGPVSEPFIPSLPDPVPQPPSTRPGGIVVPSPGRTVDLEGSENLGGYGKVRFRLLPGGKAVMSDKDGSNSGTWTKNGTQIVLAFYGGKVVYTGIVRGNRLSGTGRNGRTSWTFNVGTPTAAAPDPASRQVPAVGPQAPFRAYMVRNGQRIRFRERPNQSSALFDANRYRNTLGATEVGVEDARGKVVQRVR